jgi:hypothetical protein
MSRKEFINSEVMWEFVDREIANLDLIQEHSFVGNSEACSLILFGRKEMLDAMAIFIHSHSTPLTEIAEQLGFDIDDSDAQ